MQRTEMNHLLNMLTLAMKGGRLLSAMPIRKTGSQRLLELLVPETRMFNWK